ncbi:MAG: HDIG domain-containing protein [Candidatus Lindowbacteria bacterium]|nr:HDIG domain-containing protein [Candidatus Lindowbacteria bacterium]
MFSFFKKKRLTSDIDSITSRKSNPLRGPRFFIFVVLLVVTAAVLSQALVESSSVPVVGQISERAIFPPRGFIYYDLVWANAKWDAEMERLPATYKFDDTGFSDAESELRLELQITLDGPPARTPARKQKIEKAVNKLIARIRRVGLLQKSLPPERTLSIRRYNKFIETTASAVVQPIDWDKFLNNLEPEDVDVVATILDKALTPTLIFDTERAQEKYREISRRFPPKKTKFESEVPIIFAGQELTKRDVDLMEQLHSYHSQRNTVSIIALVAFLYLVLVFGAIYMKKYLFSFYNRLRDVSAIAFAFGASLIFCLVVEMIFDRVEFMGIHFSNAALPVAGAATVLTLLYGAGMAFIFSLLVGVLVSVVLAPRLPLLVMYIFGSMTGAIATAGARKRVDIMRSAIWISIIQAFVIIAISLILGDPVSAMKIDSVSAVISGLLSALIVPILLLPLEAISRRTSNFRLLELADLDHPLLQALLRKSPGTFQHSQHVALLAQTAAEAIGANSLLIRVGAYFHDIGKMRKPHYFTENQVGSENPHDKLKPSLSASILRSHVLEGKTMAEEEGLPEPVIDCIMQHHGTAVMSVFYHRALEAVGDEGSVDKSDFSYPGPKPQTRETGILLLADSVEAATRSLAKPTTVKLERTVKKIIIEKFEVGELNECSLTLNDINKIADSFIHVLAGMHHTRQVEYPDQGKIADAEKKKSKGDK